MQSVAVHEVKGQWLPRVSYKVLFMAKVDIELEHRGYNELRFGSNRS